MKKVEDLIPKTKFDTDKLIELDLLSSEEIAPVLPELLAWMRDMNWPVAREMPQLLAKHQKLLVPHIVDALAPEQDECDWKRWIISQLLTRFDEENLVQLKPVLKRIIDEPTWGEEDEDVNIEAAELLLKLQAEAANEPPIDLSNKSDEGVSIKSRNHDLIERTATFNSTGGFNMNYEYDEKGNIVSVTNGNGYKTSYTYDKENHLTEIKHDGYSKDKG